MRIAPLTRRLLLAAGFVLPVLATAGCTTMPDTRSERTDLRDDARTALTRMTARDGKLQPMLDGSAGYAVFPNCGKAGFLVAGSFGHGTVYDRNGKLLGYASASQASVGGTVGARIYSLLLVFQTDSDLKQFEAGHQLAFGAEATAIAIDQGASATTRYNNGVAVFAMPRGGLMADASLSGQTFRFERPPAVDVPATSPAGKDSESAELPDN